MVLKVCLSLSEYLAEQLVWNVHVRLQQLDQQLEQVHPPPVFVDRQDSSSLSFVICGRLSRLPLWKKPSYSLPLLVIPDRVENLVGRLREGERSELSWQGVVGRAVEGVELGGEEPGDGGEHKVEHVLTNV